MLRVLLVRARPNLRAISNRSVCGGKSGGASEPRLSLLVAERQREQKLKPLLGTVCMYESCCCCYCCCYLRYWSWFLEFHFKFMHPPQRLILPRYVKPEASARGSRRRRTAVTGSRWCSLLLPFRCRSRGEASSASTTRSGSISSLRPPPSTSAAAASCYCCPLLETCTHRQEGQRVESVCISVDL